MDPTPNDGPASDETSGGRDGSTSIRSVVVCTNPGPHGEAVAAVLGHHRIGVPMAYFDTTHVAPELLRRWGVDTVDEYVAALHRHRSSDDGVFAVVLTWRQLRRLVCRVIGLRPMTHELVRTVVETIAPTPTFVFVRHADPVRQAVAAYIDDHAIDAHTGAFPFDAAAIDARRTMLEFADRGWAQWLDAVDADHIDVVVDPHDDQAEVLRPLLVRLGVASDGIGPMPLRPGPLAELADEFVDRFRAPALSRSGA